MRSNHLRGWIAAFITTSLVLAGAPAASAASTVSISDPVGDVEYLSYAPVTAQQAAHADLSKVAATWKADGSMDLSVTWASTTPEQVGDGLAVVDGQVRVYTSVWLATVAPGSKAEAAVSFGVQFGLEPSIYSSSANGCNPGKHVNSGRTQTVTVPAICFEGADAVWAQVHSNGYADVDVDTYRFADSVGSFGPAVRPGTSGGEKARTHEEGNDGAQDDEVSDSDPSADRLHVALPSAREHSGLGSVTRIIQKVEVTHKAGHVTVAVRGHGLMTEYDEGYSSTLGFEMYDGSGEAVLELLAWITDGQPEANARRHDSTRPGSHRSDAFLRCEHSMAVERKDGRVDAVIWTLGPDCHEGATVVDYFAYTWGDTVYSAMVYGDATLTLPKPTFGSRPASPAREIADTCDGKQAQTTFSDVKPGSAHDATIKCLSAYGITQGKGDGTFDPGGTVTVAQIATFLARTLEAGGVTLPADSGVCEGAHGANFNRLVSAGILASDGEDGTTCDLLHTLVTRTVMTNWTVAAMAHAKVVFSAQDGSVDRFADDEYGRVEDRELVHNRAAAVGVVTGNGSGMLSPRATLSRAQMASFLIRTLDAIRNR